MGKAASVNVTASLRDKRIATGLLLGVLLIFYVTSIGTEYVQGINHGYGTGFTNQQHVSRSVIDRFEVQLQRKLPDTITTAQLGKLTNDTSNSGVWNETWRWLATVAALIGLLWFWYVVISRIGAI
jgi:hypothetical protein